MTNTVDSMIDDFMRGVGTGLGARWRGLLLAPHRIMAMNIVDIKMRRVRHVGLGYIAHHWEFVFCDGESLMIGHASTLDKARRYSGLVFPWIGIIDPEADVTEYMASRNRPVQELDPVRFIVAHDDNRERPWLRRIYNEPGRVEPDCAERPAGLS